MSEFEKSEDTEENTEKESGGASIIIFVGLSTPVEVVYHAVSGLPAEFSEFSETFDKDLPCILENCPEAVTRDALPKLWRKCQLKMMAMRMIPPMIVERRKNRKELVLLLKKPKLDLVSAR